MQEYADKYREIGRRIAFYRKYRGLTQDDLASLIHVSKSYISKIEAPGTDVSFSLDVIFAIAAGLDIDVSCFFLPINEDLISGRDNATQ